MTNHQEFEPQEKNLTAEKLQNEKQTVVDNSFGLESLLLLLEKTGKDAVKKILKPQS